MSAKLFTGGSRDSRAFYLRFLCLLLFISVSASAQTALTAPGLASFQKKVATGGGAACDSVNDSSLKAYWRLDETSGTRSDTKGANNLSDSGSTGSASAIIGNGASFSGSTALSVASDSGLQVSSGIDWSAQCWFKASSVSGFQAIIGKNTEWLIYLNGTALHFQDNQGGGVGSELISSVTISAGVWYHVIVLNEGATGHKTIIVNNGTPDVATNVDPWSSGSSAFTIGDNATAGNNIPFHGIVDEVFLTKRLLTSTEITALYSSGSGCRPTGL